MTKSRRCVESSVIDQTGEQKRRSASSRFVTKPSSPIFSESCFV
jgi:hypothetical protein